MKRASSSMQLLIPSSTSPPNNSAAWSSPGSRNKAPASIEFPTLPQPAAAGAGGEDTSTRTITHYSHPKHPLAQITLPELFVCGGCKEYGAGKRFTCQQCDYQLHEFCALSPPVLRGHPLHGQHQQLVFHSRPRQARISWPKCDICGKSSKGFTFRCKACSFQIHPCCAMLSTDMAFPEVHPHSLRLLPPAPRILQVNGGDPLVAGAAAAAGGLILVSCGQCKKKRSGGRVYQCTVCDSYHLHALCAKPFINGLEANGIHLAPDDDKPSNTMLGTAVGLASQVVIEFIGGLIDGLGEGVGQVLVQSINARGRRRRRQSTEATTAASKSVG